jgi:outer membrane protein assembly factor BamB
VVYVIGTNDPEVFALDAAYGGDRWQGEVDPGGATVAPVVAGGTLYIAATRFGITDLYVFDTELGDLQYRQRYSAEIASPLAVGAGGAYFLGDELHSGGQWPDDPRTRRLCIVR